MFFIYMIISFFDSIHNFSSTILGYFLQVIPMFRGLTSVIELKTHFQKWIQLETSKLF